MLLGQFGAATNRPNEGPHIGHTRLGRLAHVACLAQIEPQRPAEPSRASRFARSRQRGTMDSPIGGLADLELEDDGVCYSAAARCH